MARKYPLLVETLKRISSPELRNQSTIAGDIMQEVWCQYLRGNYPCWRNGGYLCYGAIGDNSYYHSVMGGRLCFAVYHGDAAIGLEALDAGVKIAGPSGTREMSLEELIPGDVLIDGRVQSHVLRSDEILTEIVLPPAKDGLGRNLPENPAARRVGFRDGLGGTESAVRGRQDQDARVIFGGIAVSALSRAWRRSLAQGQVARRRPRPAGGDARAAQRRAAQIQRAQGRRGARRAGVGSRRARGLTH